VVIQVKQQKKSSSKSKYLGSITSQAAKELRFPVDHPKGGNMSYECAKKGVIQKGKVRGKSVEMAKIVVMSYSPWRSRNEDEKGKTPARYLLWIVQEIDLRIEGLNQARVSVGDLGNTIYLFRIK